MLFNSLQYGFFLPFIFILYWLINKKYRWALLLIASYYFYMSWKVEYVLLILFTTVVSYLTAAYLEKEQNKKKKQVALVMALAVCLGVLFTFKYFNFFVTSITPVVQRMGLPLHPYTVKLLLPVGISFYTFQTLSYVIDVYREDTPAEHNFGIYATYISFFPQLVAGPIERTRNLLPQIKEGNDFDYEQTTYGLKLMVWGFFKKLVIADQVAIYADRVFDNVYAYSGFSFVLAAFFFTIQIYCDFSGYSDIARGSAMLMGIDLMENFQSPYFSLSLHDFWNRWHISLSSWLRDYVYIPLGGSRVGKMKHYRNLLITFLVSGLWHGANWTFVLWGLIHGCAQLLENLFKLHIVVKKNPIILVVRAVLVFVFVMFAWIFFRAQSIDEAIYVICNMFHGIGKPITYLFNGFSTRNHIGIGLGIGGLVKAFLPISLLALYDFVSLSQDVIKWISARSTFLRWSIYLIMIWIIIFGMPESGSSQFVYFQF